MAKRLFDIVCATLGLGLTAPAIALAMAAIRLTAGGPVLYRARRAGRGGRPFTMYKLRTMITGPVANGSRITARRDPRVFPVGRFLRASKIDELPQLVNVLRGEMSIIGPRPEHPDLVASHYAPEHHRTLTVRPGLASPGSLYHDTHGEHFLAERDTEAAYVEHLLPIKLALDLVYVRQVSLWYDLTMVWRTVSVIVGKAFDRQCFPDPPELDTARGMVVPARTRRVVAALMGIMVLTTSACELPGDAGPDDEAPVFLIGAGDISRCEDPVRDDEATAQLLDTLQGTVFTLGDNTYPDGTAEEFAQCYHPTWGRHRDRTRPAVGNHEYHTAGAAPYYEYFGDAAGEAGKGYYSYEHGSWHVIVLNSEIDMGAESPQHQWLREVLSEHDNHCMLAYWHKPRFNRGSSADTKPALEGIWRTLYEAGVDVVVNGHEHSYQRHPPLTPAGDPDPDYGIHQFIVGTGGGDVSPVEAPYLDGVLQEGPGTAGVIVFTLRADRYEWTFVPIAHGTFTDAGERACHDPPSGAVATQPTGARVGLQAHSQLLRMTR